MQTLEFIDLALLDIFYFSQTSNARRFLSYCSVGIVLSSIALFRLLLVLFSASSLFSDCCPAAVACMTCSLPKCNIKLCIYFSWSRPLCSVSLFSVRCKSQSLNHASSILQGPRERGIDSGRCSTAIPRRRCRRWPQSLGVQSFRYRMQS